MLTRDFEISAAYDKRPKYGQHCVDMTFYVKGPRGVVQFKLFTGWYPNIIATPEKSWQELRVGELGPHDRPMPADLGYHSPVPIYEGQNAISDSCPVLDGRKCYCDGSSLNANRIFSIMVHEGGEAMWKALEEYYRETFEPKREEVAQ